MFIARNLISAFAATAIASSAAVALSPTAAADPAAPPAPIPAQQSPGIPGLPGLPALTELSPIIQQAASNPEQATQLLMAAAQAFSRDPSASEQSKSVAQSVNEAASTAHVVPPGVEPGAQAHLPTGIDPVHAAGPAPEAAAAPAPAPANVVPVAATPPAPAAPAGPVPAAAAAPTPSGGAGAPAAVAPGYSPDSPPTQDFMYPSISSNCAADGGNVLAPVLSVAGPAKIPAPGPNAGQTAYVFTALGTPGPADVQKLPLNVTWVNLTTGKSGSATLKPQADINPQGPTTLVATVDTGSGSVMSTIFGQVTTKDKQCQFMPTIGSTVVP
jgi:hypothetical protein